MGIVTTICWCLSVLNFGAKEGPVSPLGTNWPGFQALEMRNVCGLAGARHDVKSTEQWLGWLCWDHMRITDDQKMQPNVAQSDTFELLDMFYQVIQEDNSAVGTE